MKGRYISTSFLLAIMALVTILLFAIPVSAVTRARESELKGGWQIWIEASDFSRRDAGKTIKLGAEADEKLQRKIVEPVLGEDYVITSVQGGWMEYEFESMEAGNAYGYYRVMDYRGGGQSWHVMLNTEVTGQGKAVDTGMPWVWNTAREGTPQFPKDLKEGRNTVRITPREAGGGQEVLFDIICISTKELRMPVDDDDWSKATPIAPEAVDFSGKLTTTWGTIKNRF